MATFRAPKVLGKFGRRKRLAIEFYTISVVVIFIVEFFIMMLVLPVFLSDLSVFWIAIVDSVTLIVFLLPILYVLVLGPLNRLSSEQRIAEEVQKIILGVPDKPAGLRCGYVYQSATIDEAKIGGDFFDLYELRDGKVGIVIGDVAGKGLEAAKIANSAKLAIKAYAYQESSPAKVMSLANNLITKNSEDTIFVTTFFAVFDRKNAELRFCNAGHTESFIKRGVDASLELLEARSLALGISLDHGFSEGQTKLEVGDSLILYTDGVTDARCGDQLFGEDKLIEIIERPTSNPMELPDVILREALSFASETLADDLAVLVISPEPENVK